MMAVVAYMVVAALSLYAMYLVLCIVLDDIPLYLASRRQTLPGAIHPKDCSCWLCNPIETPKKSPQYSPIVPQYRVITFAQVQSAFDSATYPEDVV